MLEVALLGQFEVRHDGKLIAIPSRGAQSLFSYLILNAGKAHRRERLAGIFWPDSTEDSARSNLRHELWRLRKALEVSTEAYFIVDDLAIAFDSQAEYNLDVELLEKVEVETASPEELATALSYYAGDFLPGFYADWVVIERERLASIYEAKMARLLSLLQTAGRWEETGEWANRWIARGFWPEPAFRALMAAHASLGDTSRAITTYERLRKGLKEDLGVEPSYQTQELFEQLCLGWKPDARSGDSTRTAVLDPPQPAVQPPVQISPFAARRSNIPRPLTNFVGREKEKTEVGQLLTDGRLVTITGPGGVGKTRMAIEVANALTPHFKNGVCWIGMASHTAVFTAETSGFQPAESAPGASAAEESVAQATAAALGVAVNRESPPMATLVEYLQGRELLLLFDNCEHVVEPCAVVMQELLSACPGIRILATSREAFRLAGEKAWPLPALDLPGLGESTTVESLLQHESVRLFVDRAQDVLTGYQPDKTDAAAIARICRRLDGIPLAIELAAARMNMLSPSEIDSHLDDPLRFLSTGRRAALQQHRTIQATIVWSYGLLDGLEQALFRRLSVFEGSFTVDAAVSVCSDESIQADDVLSLLGRLIDKSLVQPDPAPQYDGLARRYRMLETVRAYGTQKLDEAGETRSVMERRAVYFVGLAEAAEPAMLEGSNRQWFKLLNAETGNIWAVVDWAAENNDPESALRMVGALTQYWWTHGSLRLLLALVRKVLSLQIEARWLHYHAKALKTAGFLHYLLKEGKAARQAAEEAMAIFKSSGDEAGLASSMHLLGMVLELEGKYEQAESLIQDSVTIARRVGKPRDIVHSLPFLGDPAFQQGNLSRAEAIYKDSAEKLRAMGEGVFEAYPLRRLGYLALESGDYAAAAAYFGESLSLNLRYDDIPSIAACLAAFGALAGRLDRLYAAANLLGAAESMLESSATELIYLDRAAYERTRSSLCDAIGEAAVTTAVREGWQLGNEKVMAMVAELAVPLLK